MKTLKNISLILVATSTLLASCTTLLASSSLSSCDSDSFIEEEFEDEEEVIISQHMVGYSCNNDLYSEVFQIPVDGGSYEFECEYVQFYISKIFDTSLPCTFEQFSTQVFKPVNAWIYNGPFYTITCDTRNHVWKIEVEPLISLSEIRQIWVLMWPGFDKHNYVFQFEQGDPDS